MFALMCVMCLCAKAAKLTEGSFDCLKGQKEISVELNLTQTTFKKKYGVEEFLKKHHRAENWKEGSVLQFVKEFNEGSYKVSLSATAKAGSAYTIELAPGVVTGGGEFKEVKVSVKESATGAVKAVVMLDSDDGDSNDEIAFKDTMGDLGEQLGKFFASKIKKLK